MKQPKISQLRNKISFYSKSKIQQPDFTFVETEVAEFNAWGFLEMYVSSSRPGYTINPTDDFDGIRITHTIIMRYDARVRPDHIIRSSDHKYKIHGYDPLIYGKQRYLSLRVEQIGDGTGDCS